VLRILDVKMLGEQDCALVIELAGTRHDLVARRIRHDDAELPGVGDFEPRHVFHHLSLSAAQLRAVVRTAVQVRCGEPLSFPVDVPA
jgi:hypothetical protein